MTDTVPTPVVDTALEDVPARLALTFAEVPGEVTLQTLPGRDLTPQELRQVATDVARRAHLWRPLVAFNDDKRHYASLHRDAHVDVWVLCWTDANDTGWHDHDISSGAVAVAEGTLVEHNLTVGAPLVETEVPTGMAFCFGTEHIHRLTATSYGSVSIHAYSPPLWRLGQYAVGRSGMLRRVSVSYADELRPIDDMF